MRSSSLIDSDKKAIMSITADRSTLRELNLKEEEEKKSSQKLPISVKSMNSEKGKIEKGDLK